MAGPFIIPIFLLTLLPLIAAGKRREVAWTTAGSFLVTLGVAAVAPEWESLAAAPISFLAISAGFIWVGFALIGFGFPPRSAPRTPGSLVSGMIRIGVSLAAIWTFQPLLVAGGWWGAVAALVMGVCGVLLAIVFGWLKLPARIQAIDDRWLAREHAPTPALTAQAELFTWIAMLAALSLVLFTHTLVAFGLAAFAVVLAAHRLMRQQGKAAPFPLRPILAALSLFAFYLAVRTIAGPDIPLSFPGIHETPFSDAAEGALALVIGLGAWVMLGLWPFHGAGAGSAAAIVGGVFLIRWGNGLIPDGMAVAAPIFAVVAMVAALHASATGRVGEFAGSLGVLAVTAQSRSAWGFFAIATCLAVVRLLPKGASRIPLCPPGLDRRQFGAILLIPALAVGLPWMLRGEAFQTAIAVFAGIPLVLSMRE